MREPIAGGTLLLVLCMIYACIVQYTIVDDVVRQEDMQLLLLNTTSGHVARARGMVRAASRLAALGDWGGI